MFGYHQLSSSIMRRLTRALEVLLLFSQAKRQRGNECGRHVGKGCPPVLRW